MKLIFLKNNSTNPKTVILNKSLAICACALFMVFVGVLLGIGVLIGKPDANLLKKYQSLSVYGLQESIAQEKANIENTKQYVENNLVALSARLGGLQAQVSRIDAVGKRLANATEIDLSTFDYDQEPAQGGQEDGQSSNSLSLSANDLIAEMDSMESALNKHEASMKALGVSLSEIVLKEDQTPEGMPVKNGWISSAYGWRASPISGERRFHRGVDIPSKSGAAVMAVADGVVIRSEKVALLGNVVELNHGDGLTTLYAHNSKNLVSIGESVSKGDSIAKVGSTGRSTGPHVHFEVRQYGKNLNPKSFLR